MSTRPNTSSKICAALLFAGLGAGISGCSDDINGAQTCRNAADCQAEGYDCDLKRGVCAAVCQQSMCQAGAECSSSFGSCTAVSCGQFVPCKDPGDLCNRDAHACYPSSGQCSVTADCPRFDGRVSRSATLQCQDGFCRVTSLPPPILAAMAADRNAAALQVLSPAYGAQVDSTSQLQFQWQKGLDATWIALVLTDLPQDLSQVLNTAVWGRVLPAGSEPVARWQDGVAIQGGTWLPSSAVVPSGPLYFLVQAVRAGQLVGISTPLPFRIGSAWPVLYDRCSDNNVLPGSCKNPLRPQICWGGYCRLVCASHLDCKADGSTLCGAADHGVRICG